jgi:hypothetical protein
MSDQYGSDFITIVDEDGTEYELEVLTTLEYKTQIMEAVRDAAGLKTEGGAIIFSLPVDDLVGVGRFEDYVDGEENK